MRRAQAAAVVAIFFSSSLRFTVYAKIMSNDRALLIALIYARRSARSACLLARLVGWVGSDSSDFRQKLSLLRFLTFVCRTTAAEGACSSCHRNNQLK